MAEYAELTPQAFMAKMHNQVKAAMECLKKELAWVRLPHYPFKQKRTHMEERRNMAKLDPATIDKNNILKKRTTELYRTIWERGECCEKFRLLFFLFLLAPTTTQMLGVKAVLEQHQYILMWWEKVLDLETAEVLQVLKAEYRKLWTENFFEGLPTEGQ
jgi:hypothetical protein